ncbi:unnamed protein product [Heterosigma akashiwo]
MIARLIRMNTPNSPRHTDIMDLHNFSHASRQSDRRREEAAIAPKSGGKTNFAVASSFLPLFTIDKVPPHRPASPHSSSSASATEIFSARLTSSGVVQCPDEEMKSIRSSRGMAIS